MEPITLIIVGIASILVLAASGGAIFYGISRRIRREVSEEAAQQIKNIQEGASSQIDKIQAGWETKLQRTCGLYDVKLQVLARELNEEINRWQRKHKEVLSQKKRSEVRCGHILEKVAPLLDDFPADITSDVVIPLFGVVDYLVVDLDQGVYFVEVKSNNASLSSRQKKVKKLIEDGCVFFRTFRRRGQEEESKDGQDDSESAGG